MANPNDEFADAFVRAAIATGEPAAERVDGDERQFGRTAQHGLIAGVADADSGAIEIQTGRANEIPARILGYRYPMPRVGDSVQVIYTIDGAAYALPINPELPSTFTAVVHIPQGAGRAIVRHDFADVGSGDGLAPVVVAAHIGQLQAGDIVACLINYRGRVAASPYDTHTIVAVAKMS